MFLLPVPANPIVPIVLDGAFLGWHQEEAGFGPCRLMHHAAEIKPLAIVASTAEAPSAGQFIATTHGNTLAGRS